MREDALKCLELLEEDNVIKIFNEYGIDFDEIEGNFDELLRYRDDIYSKYFSFLDKYLNNKDFFKELDVDNNFDKLFFLKFFVSDEFYHNLLDYYYNGKSLNDVDGFIINDNDLEYYLSKGYSIVDIVRNIEIVPDIRIKILKENPDALDIFLEKSSSIDSEVAALLVSRGKLEYLNKYFSAYGSFQEQLASLLTVLSKYDNYDFNSFLEVLYTNYLNNDISFSSFSYRYNNNGNDVSVLTDEDVVRRLIGICGDRALIFAKNPSLELVSETDFSYYDYTFYDGSYKNSSALLVKLLKEGKLDALAYAKEGAINSEVIEIIKENNLSVERIKSYSNISNSYLLCQYLSTLGDYSLICKLSNIFSDINCFNYVYNLFNSGEHVFNKNDYNNSEDYNLMRAFMTSDWEKTNLYGKVKFSSEVASRLVDLGLTVDEFVRFLAKMNDGDLIIKAFLDKGVYLPLLFAQDNELISQNIDHISFDLYLKAKNTYGDIGLSKILLAKFFKEGHYECLDNDNLYISEYDLEMFGLNNISYEDYLKLPDYVRNIPVLKNKFIEMEPSYLLDLLKSNPDRETFEKAVLSGMSFDEIEPYFNGNPSFSSKTVLELLKKGDRRCLKYLDGYSYRRDETYDEIIRLYLELLNGELPQKEELKDRTFSSFIVEEFLKQSRFEIFTIYENIFNIDINLLFNSGYNFEMFKKYPVLNRLIIERFVNLDYEDELVNVLKELHDQKSNFYIDNSSLLFVKMYRCGFKKENLKIIQNLLRIDCNVLLKNITEEEYDIFNIVDFRDINNKLFLTKLINHLSVDKFKELLSSYGIDSDTRLFIIKTMVLRGNYEFVSYYNDKIEEDVLKRALLGGYFPEDNIINNKFFNLFLRKLQFTQDELKYLRSKISSDSRYIIFFPEIINDNRILIQYIISNHSIIGLLDDSKKKDINLLKAIVSLDPKLCSEMLYNSISSTDIVELLKLNIYLLDYIDEKYLNTDIISSVVDFYPYVIDYYKGYLSYDIVIEAFNNGYQLSLNSSLNIIKVALKQGYKVNREILINLELPSIFNLLKDLVDDIDDELSSEFREILRTFYNNDKYDFIYNYILFIRTNNIFNEKFNEFFKYLNIDFVKYNNFDISSKSSFIFACRLNDLARDESSLPKLDELLVYGDVKSIINWIDNYLPSSELANGKKHELAKKYFLEEPLYYIQHADISDIEIIKLVKDNIFDYPLLFRYVPQILDNQELIIKLISLIDDYYVYELFENLNYEFKNNIEILKNAISRNENIFSLVDHSNPLIIKFAKDNILDYPIVFEYVPDIIVDKEIALKLTSYKNGLVFHYLPDYLKEDFDICSSLLKISPSLILEFSNKMERYSELLLIALKKNGSLITSIKLNEVNEDMVIAAIQTYPDAIFISDEYTNENVFSHLKDLTQLSADSLSIERIMKIIHFTNFDFNNKKNCEFLVDYILNNVNNNVNYLDKNDSKLKELFKNGINFENYNANGINDDVFKKVIRALSYSSLDISSLDIFEDDVAQVLKDALIIISSTGKLNTLDKNPIFSYDVVKYIYPLFGLDFVKELLKYNTSAATQIVNEVKANNGGLLYDYYNIICGYNIFPQDDKRVHYAFRYFSDIKLLVTSIIQSGEELTSLDIVNLRKIILRKNSYNINSLEDLRAYDEKTHEYWCSVMNTADINIVKDTLATLFGYPNLGELAKDFNNFQLDNFLNLKAIRDDIITKYGKEEAKQIFQECFCSKKDVSIIILASRIIKSDNINELKELMNDLMVKKNGALDYCDEFMDIISKVRMLYNYQFNGRLTKIDDIKSKRISRDDPNNPYGVTIIEMDSEKFNFLAHRIYSYDPKMGGFKQMLIDDPSLWTKLEGASTLSTSSISDKGFWFIHNYDNTGVVYLFNNLPKDFMLFMYGRDLYVEHGGYKIEPTSSNNTFTSIDGLNQCSCYKHCSYNEVAGFREGMLPCALACVGDTPNEGTIRAAKYFSQYLGVDIPIIKFDIPAYDKKKQDDLVKAEEEFKQTLSYDAMHTIFFDGIRTLEPEKTVKDKITYCFNILNNKYRNGELSIEQLAKSLLNMQSMVSQITVDLPDAQKEISRIAVFVRTILMLNNVSREEVISLETASLGESGIMYQYSEGENKYLLKPAVDKKNYASQPFRADIQEAASKLQEYLSPSTAVRVESIGKKSKVSKQEYVSISSDKSSLLQDWVSNGGELDYQYSSALLREYVVDFLLCNFDCFVGNFIIDSEDNLRGIDKEQSFRFIDNPESLKADFSYTPNGQHRIPIYQILFSRYKQGEIDLDLSVITDTIDKVKLLSDDEYKDMFRDYARSLDKNHEEEILNKILMRRYKAIESINQYLKELYSLKKSEGVKL